MIAMEMVQDGDDLGGLQLCQDEHSVEMHSNALGRLTSNVSAL